MQPLNLNSLNLGSNPLLEMSNEVFTAIIIISIIFDSILLIITDKDTTIKRLDHHHKKLLEFKQD